MNICVIGTGYVGLVTGACFSEFGIKVTCVDKEKKKIEALKKGQIPLYEPGLEEIVKRNTKEERLLFTSDIAHAVRKSLVIFIAVGTPPRGDGSADLAGIDEVARAIAENMNGYKVIVTKSTVPVGTGERIRKIIIQSQREKSNFDIASNPEFLREGSAIEDFMRPNRVVIGASSEQAIAILKDLYSPLYLIETPFVITDIKTAEMIKYATNAFLATKISFINEIANICEKVGADVHVVAKGIGLDNRIGPKFLHPGPGYGGSCLPKDALAISKIARDHGYEFKLIDTVISVNDRQKVIMVEKIKKAVGDLKGKTIGVLGLSFKPNTNDIRESPAIAVINRIQKEGAKIKAYDPAAIEEAKKVLEKVIYCKDSYEVAKNSDALIIMTEWNQFRNLDIIKLKDIMKKPMIIDLRNIYDPKRMKELGFDYTSVGR
ncbi:MAG: UDP-glucose/GDP-mannose dehydrogenase family protein [Nitrospirota bacterium]